MKTECTINTNNFRFTITGKRADKYELQIENPLPWGETVIAYGLLTQQEGNWVLDDMTFENAHQECVLQLFFIDLWKLRANAYPEAVKYYEANRHPDVFEIADKILENRKAI